MKNLVFILLATLAMASCSKGDDPVTTYTVTFDANGGNPTPVAQSVKAGDKVVAPANPTKQNYVFLFWSLNGTSAYNFQLSVNSDITLQAKWEDAAISEYWQVSWELNGGFWPSADNHVTQVVKGGTLSEPAAPAKPDQTFDGWYKESALANKISFPYDVSAVTANFTLYAKWTTDNGGTTDPTGYKMFTSISELKSWLSSQSANTADTPYKVGLKNVNLDSGNNWADLGIAIGEANKTKYVDLYLNNCTSTAIPDGYYERELQGTMVTYKYYGVFIGLENLVVATLPKGIKTIGTYAFRECKNLISVNLPEGLTEIHEDAFRDCMVLSSVIFPETLTSIGKWAFRNCNGITSVNLPENLKNIDIQAFQYCGLTTLTIPATLTGLASSVFADNSKLISVVIAEGIETVEASMFSGCQSLESVTLPKSFKTIGQSMFRDCKALKNLEIPSNVTLIDASAFYNAFTSGTLIMHSATPPALGWLPFQYSSLKTIKVPASSLSAYKTASGWSAYADKIVANTN
ncbi:MAG: leucine-rich repeat protein [Tannerellaceae bacterium]|jgi:uncharacterized repeat protein (TIGR02543 family)|nr:leucine-rich repeat protein [Tannerellaceae bacterium]